MLCSPSKFMPCQTMLVTPVPIYLGFKQGGTAGYELGMLRGALQTVALLYEGPADTQAKVWIHLACNASMHGNGLSKAARYVKCVHLHNVRQQKL